jgi:hypothetical protein
MQLAGREAHYLTGYGREQTIEVPSLSKILPTKWNE